jgi:hypothetical protein
MKKQLVYSVLIIVLVISSFSFVNLALAKGPYQGGTSDESDSNPVGAPEVVIPEMYQPIITNAVVPLTPKGTPIYFTPQDENTSTTVLFIYNTTKKDALIGLQTYYIDGSLTIDTKLTVPALSMMRICSDTVTTVSASWVNSVLINFTTFSAYAKMILPAGVKAEGYVAYDSTGVYDPLTEANVIPLRFSVKQLTVP